MKFINHLLIIFLFPILAFSQGKQVEIIQDKIDNNISLKAKNNSTNKIALTFELTSTGFGLPEIKTFNIELDQLEEKDIVLLKPKPNERWNYKYSTKFKILKRNTAGITGIDKQKTIIKPKTSANKAIPGKSPARPDTPIPDGIVVYSKNNCGRCTQTINFLNANDIEYSEKSISKSKEHNKEMETLLLKSGFKGGVFITPVILVNGEVNHTIMDLGKFLTELNDSVKSK